MNAQDEALLRQCSDALGRIERECIELREGIAKALSPSPIADAATAPAADAVPTISMIPIRTPAKTYIEKSTAPDLSDMFNNGRLEDVE